MDTYNLPDLPVRILSLVPKKATDIRDSVQESFAAPKARLVRATSQFIAAGILFGLSVLMVAFAVVHIVRRKRERAPVHAAALSDTRLMRACLQEISRLRSEALRNGWTPERAASALTVLRIGIAVAIVVGLSRVYLGVHWPTDVAAGWAIGAALGMFLVFLSRLRYAFVPQ